MDIKYLSTLGLCEYYYRYVIKFRGADILFLLCYISQPNKVRKLILKTS